MLGMERGHHETSVSRKSTQPRKRKANVYDAVAGKVTRYGFLRTKDVLHSTQPLRPDEVLFRKENAPTRYEETDYYFKHRDLPEGQKLPSGDLLSTIHAYIASLYAKTQDPKHPEVWKSMDETALIAFGILMEETTKEILGPTGDLALMEAAPSDEETDDEAFDESESESGSSYTTIKRSEVGESLDSEDHKYQDSSRSEDSSDG